jgi:hypothetical protein
MTHRNVNQCINNVHKYLRPTTTATSTDNASGGGAPCVTAGESFGHHLLGIGGERNAIRALADTIRASADTIRALADSLIVFSNAIRIFTTTSKFPRNSTNLL